jgi:hypothetical protein
MNPLLMDAGALTNSFLQSVDALVGNTSGKWSFVHLKTSHGTETRNGFLDACSELFVPFIGQSKPVIYEAVRDALRRRGDNWAVQRYAGMVLLNLVSDAYGQVDELIDIVAPVFDVSNGEIPAFLVEQVGLDPLLRKIEVRKQATKDPELLSCLGGLAYQAEVYHNRKTRKIGWHENT